MPQTFNKPALSIADQIALMRARGMIVPDQAYAEHVLLHVSYYRLRAYWLYFEIDLAAGDHTLRQGTTLNDVMAIYDFDRRLRLLLIDCIERIEVALRGSWAYRMATLHGPHGYLDPAKYPNSIKFATNVSQLQSEYDRSHEVFVNHHRNHYGQPSLPPVWMAAEFMSFGLLSKFLSSLGSKADKRAIAQPFDLEEWALSSFAHHIAAIRNICAHHGRLWNRRLTVTAQLPRRSADLAASLEPASGRQIYNTLTICAHIIRKIAPGSDWKMRMVSLLNSHPNQDLAAMGFPSGWRLRPEWA